MQRYGFASAPISNGGYNNYFIIEFNRLKRTLIRLFLPEFL